MSRTLVCCITLISLAGPLLAQTAVSDANTQASRLQINSRAVLVDVIVTDSAGNPVTGLPKSAFTVMEQSKPQAVSFFEENGPAHLAQTAEMPKLPPDVFTNFSPFPQPPTVNVLLLDSLNTGMESQSDVHNQMMKFLKSAKPGTRSAIFAMGQSLRFIQGFNDDPAVLATALDNRKSNEVETSTLMNDKEETAAEQSLSRMTDQAGAGSLQQFFGEINSTKTDARMLITLANLQRLAAFLNGFPGRKNILWFVEKPPAVFRPGGTTGNPAIDDELKKTLAMLATARAAIYPVYANGIVNYNLYTAENNLSQSYTKTSQVTGSSSVLSASMNSDDGNRITDQLNAQLMADQSGGRAFVTNGISDLIDKVTADSSHFYTLSYTPANAKMDGSFRKIEVTVTGGKYNLSYRRGYFAVDTRQPGSAISIRNEKSQKPAAQNSEAVNPLLPYMDLGMPQSEQILYEVRISPVAANGNEPADKKDKNEYKVDFAVDLKDLRLTPGADGIQNCALNVSLVVYDRLRNIISHEDHLVNLNITPDMYQAFQQTGVQLHAQLAVPAKGQYWLRTGVYHQASHKAGTMEVALSSVVPLQVSAK